MRNYLSNIQKYDGIDQEEAVLLAQTHLIFLGLDKAYYVDHPEIILVNARSYNVKFIPLNKTLGEVISKSPAVIGIDRRNGDAMLIKSAE